MKVFFHEDFYRVYASDPAAAAGRMEAVVEVLESAVEFVLPRPALEAEISAVHTPGHIENVKREGVYDVAALAAGAAIETSMTGLAEPCFGLIRPPGHHASSSSAWGFCYFNNMAISLDYLKRNKKIDTAFVLDIDLHFGDGTVNILESRRYVTIHNVSGHDRDLYLMEVKGLMRDCRADVIGISAGFDNHELDWGGTLRTEDYREIGRLVLEAARRNRGGCFGILEGGYNHLVLGQNVLALIQGLSGD